MTTCPQNAPGPFTCPTLVQSIEATAALLPSGRAWPARSRGMAQRFLQWLGGLAGAIPTAWPAGFVQAGYVAAIGAVRNYLETQLCALRLEFWCASQTLTRDLWLAEYGLPDECEPFPDLCDKVAAIGGARCEFYAAIAAQRGWSITCSETALCGGAIPRAGRAQAGCAQAAGVKANTFYILVNLEESPAYAGGFKTPSLAGRMLAGMPNACPPDITLLRCLIDRIAQAHLIVVYVTS